MAGLVIQLSICQLLSTQAQLTYSYSSSQVFEGFRFRYTAVMLDALKPGLNQLEVLWLQQYYLEIQQNVMPVKNLNPLFWSDMNGLRTVTVK